MELPNDRLYQIALSQVSGIGVRKMRSLLERFNQVEFLFHESLDALRAIPELSGVDLSEIKNKSTLLRAEQELNFVRDEAIDIISIIDQDYPKRLKHCSDAPALLFKKGNMRLNEERFIAIVGTRRATHYGREITEQIVEQLKPYNAAIVSGLAIGIDGFAHKNASYHKLQNIAVLAHGLDRVYPAAHSGLAAEMLQNGGLISEYMTQTEPDRNHFPDRNRIVAGMVDAVIVVESRIQGGSMITAEIAHSYFRDVFAVPGKLTDQNSKGCNLLIKSQKAIIYTGAKDLEYNLGWTKTKNAISKQRQLFVDLSPIEESILNLLKEKGRIDLDTICTHLSDTSQNLSMHLFNLELNGLIAVLPGKQYELK